MVVEVADGLAGRLGADYEPVSAKPDESGAAPNPKPRRTRR